MMKKIKAIIILVLCFGFPISVFAEQGIVVEENICGEENVVIKITDGSYVIAERFYGAYLKIGDIISQIRRMPDPIELGEFISPQEITINNYDNNGEIGFFRIEKIDFDENLKEPCY